MTKPITQNTLFYGDNLPILREHVPDESVDLVYLDPPFNSNRSYNVLFKNESGQEAEAQITAFDDTWHWDKSAALTYHALIQNAPAEVVKMIGALREFIGENQMMAYLVMMTARLLELHRVLKPTGSLYLHCDPTASHYLKVVLDTIFGGENFLSEIIWKRSHSHNSAKRYGPIHDVILYYSKTEYYLWNDIRQSYAQDHIENFSSSTTTMDEVYIGLVILQEAEHVMEKQETNGMASIQLLRDAIGWSHRMNLINSMKTIAFIGRRLQVLGQN